MWASDWRTFQLYSILQTPSAIYSSKQRVRPIDCQLPPTMVFSSLLETSSMGQTRTLTLLLSALKILLLLCQLSFSKGTKGVHRLLWSWAQKVASTTGMWRGTKMQTSSSPWLINKVSSFVHLVTATSMYSIVGFAFTLTRMKFKLLSWTNSLVLLWKAHLRNLFFPWTIWKLGLFFLKPKLQSFVGVNFTSTLSPHLAQSMIFKE